MLTQSIYLDNEEATLGFGQRLARATFADEKAHLPRSESVGVPTLGAVIYLLGDLGAGKTTLTRGLLRGYGYQGAVKSPTYTLVEPYEFDRCHIYHFDLYRLADPEEVEYLGTEEYFRQSNLCIVEWADRGKGLIPDADVSIELTVKGAGRDLHCRFESGKGRLIAKRMGPEGRN